ncbi:S-adenosylmethionine synthetase [Halobacteriales archaeon SW_7_68_16]|nr:MAG: S-adenosylmethionine synthetase [Halobacteriales archaeon SW_7_68_16]
MTDRNVCVEPLEGRAVEDQDIEIVERKGIGHPDSLCDGIAEAVSRRLSRAYIDRVGTVLHYNTDETQLVAGSAVPAFGGGEVVEPIYVLITGRATSEYDGTHIPTETLALEAAREYLNAEIPELDFGRDIVVDAMIGEGSGDLRTVFGEEDGPAVPLANDTSFGVGHAPLTETERIVLSAERGLNGEYEDPAVGPDVKIMGKREGDRIDVTVAAAVIDRHTPDFDAYTDTVEGVREYVGGVARRHTDREVAVHVNTADDYDERSIYLTTTGISAEQGDDGSVGRGNRVNGLITPNRSMSMEAASGKNPVNHVGKIYNLLSTEIARAVVDEVDGVADVRLRLLSQIGEPIDRPHVADAHVVTTGGVAIGDVAPEIEAIVDRELASVTDLTRRAIEGEVDTF